MMTAVKIAVVDDHPLFREGVTRSFSEIEDFEIVGEGGSRDDAIRIAREFCPDVMLIDISMPGSGLETITDALEYCPTLKIVMLTVSEASDDITKALKLGAKGYVLKGIGSRGLAEVVRTIAAGGSYVSPALSAQLIAGLSASAEAVEQPDPMAELTDREQEVLNLVASGLSNKRVARELDLHEKTVKHHMTRIFSKLKVSNRTEAALALRDATVQRSTTERPQS
ncbi:LuxR C-terminal-related transcriptional regulator [Neorhizobium petrolearium]|uniref:Response regulator transcription factor n=2 Tax=Rhizobium/Agrobacterium group TaxID=227290 RepID=A0ABY8MA31_9HYPH|nr:response regulator transcription factor [Neorhizobium petrolearium]MCC2608473.1 response regulator transcription factor [Neorhizobium petrolearium]WGI71368.1 response regulator transcription factor [Neorhizobium petrolearium]